MLTKPLGSLGQLEAVAAQYVAWREDDVPRIAGKAVYVFAADHGITDEGISAYPREVTQQMVRNFLMAARPSTFWRGIRGLTLW